MAVPAKTKKHRDPDDPVQVLRTKKHGEVRVDGRFWIDGKGVGKIIVPTPAGGYRYARGGPIRTREDLLIIPEGPEREKALAWWDNKDRWQETAPRKIAFEAGTGYPIFEDTGEYVEREEDLLAYWPTGDILWAAIRSLGKRRDNKVEQPEPRVTLGVVQGNEVPPPQVEQVETPEPVYKPPRLTNKGAANLVAANAARKAKSEERKAAKAAEAAVE